MNVYAVRVLLLLCLSACAFYTRALNAQQACAVTISLPDPVVKAGSEIFVAIDLSNISKQDIVIAKSRGTVAAFSGFVFRVTDQNGNPAAKRKTDKEGGKSSTFRIDGLLKGSKMLITLNPGEHVQQKVRIDTLYDLLPGTYLIQAERADEEGVAFTKSNIVTLTLTE
jgi:hypothetical protein